MRPGTKRSREAAGGDGQRSKRVRLETSDSGASDMKSFLPHLTRPTLDELISELPGNPNTSIHVSTLIQSQLGGAMKSFDPSIHEKVEKEYERMDICDYRETGITSDEYAQSTVGGFLKDVTALGRFPDSTETTFGLLDHIISHSYSNPESSHGGYSFRDRFDGPADGMLLELVRREGEGEEGIFRKEIEKCLGELEEQARYMDHYHGVDAADSIVLERAFGEFI